MTIRNTRISNGKQPSRGRRPAFTLIELLVTIAIIALLAGILLPALGRAKEQAKCIATRSNVQQLMTAVAMYRSDWRSYLPKSMSLLEEYVGDPDLIGEPLGDEHYLGKLGYDYHYLYPPEEPEGSEGAGGMEGAVDVTGVDTVN